MIAPKYQYSVVDGQATDWHLMHWTDLLNSCVGLSTVAINLVAVLPSVPANNMKEFIAFPAGKLKALAVTNKKRHAGMPQVPTIFVSPTDMTKLLDCDIADWTQAIHAVNIKLD